MDSIKKKMQSLATETGNAQVKQIMMMMTMMVVVVTVMMMIGSMMMMT